MAVLPKNAPRGLSAEEIRRRQNPRWESRGDESYDPRSATGRLRDAVRDSVSGTRRLSVDARDLTWDEKLARDTERASQILAERLGKSDIFATVDPLERQLELNRQHRDYALMMLASMMSPIRERPRDTSRFNAVLTTVGMGVGMWLASPTFRSQTMHLPRTTMELWDERVRERIQSKVESKTSRGQRVGKFLQARYDRVMQAEDGGHAPYCDYSAALMVVSLSDQFYEKVREPGADVKVLSDRYAQTMNTLYHQASRDGVDPVAIDANARYIVGRRMVTDPNYANHYSHTAYDQVRRTDPVEREVEQPDGSVVREYIWDGSFHHRDGGTVSTSDPGYFAPRLPADVDEHIDHISKAVQHELGQARTVGDLHTVLMAWAGGRLPTFQEAARQTVEQGGDSYPLDSIQRLDRMFGAMAEDGYDPSDSQQMYALAFSNALTHFNETNPELVQKWSQEYGETWDIHLNEMLSDPEAAEARLRESAEQVRQTRFAQERARREAEWQAQAEEARREASTTYEGGWSGQSRQQLNAPVAEPILEDVAEQQETLQEKPQEPHQPHQVPEPPASPNEAGFDSTDTDFDMGFDDDFAELGDDPYDSPDARREEAAASQKTSQKKSSQNARQQAQRDQQAREQRESAGFDDNSRSQSGGTGNGGHERAGGFQGRPGDRSGHAGRSGLVGGATQRQARQQSKRQAQELARRREMKDGFLPVQDGVELSRSEQLLAERRAKATSKRRPTQKVETVISGSIIDQAVKKVNESHRLEGHQGDHQKTRKDNGLSL